jgi:hypothetical protein
MKSASVALTVALLLGGCVSNGDSPQYSLTGDQKGIFHSANAGRPIPLDQIKGMNEQQLQTTFGAAGLDRKDGSSRVLRYQSDACVLFVYVSANRVTFADALDPQMRPLPPDDCAGSVAAQKRRVS